MHHLVFVCFLDSGAVEEIPWVDFVDCWQDDTVTVFSVYDGDGSRVKEHTFEQSEKVIIMFIQMLRSF